MRRYACQVDEIELSMSLPLDGDGFLRRECPTCERDFKWLPAQDDADHTRDAEVVASYFCPYCVVSAPPDAWLTKAQVTVMHDIVRRELIDPEMDKLKREIAKVNRSSGGFLGISASLDRDEPETAPELSEVDDMRRVEFGCHPAEPVKVLDEWTGAVHCLVCGEPAATT